MSLDDKLREILDYCAETYYPLHEYPDQPIYIDHNKVTLDEAIAQIKQAFADAGYTHLGKGVVYRTLEDTDSDAIRFNGKTYLTGIEFYNRFLNEYEPHSKNPDETKIMVETLKAAKRASGIE